ncbi:MAG TPA: ABC transporter substrate-binding protein [Candidatus Competibacter sp.]|nr:ABC transporter substrate-binding protein [Candidatus Competibacter sp.]
MPIFASGLTAILLLITSFFAFAAESPRTVALTQIVEHPSLDAARHGILDELAAAGYTLGQNLKIDYQNAQGNPITAAQIARKFVGDRPDVIVTITTPSAQAVVAATRELPVVFCSVSDPLGAKLVNNLAKPGGNVTGTSDLSPIAEQLDLIRELSPDVKKLGVIYNPGEANSVSLVALLKTQASGKGLQVIEATAPKSGDVLSAARQLAGKAEAIYIPLDNTVVSALEAVIKVGRDARIPVYSADTDSVGRGTVASLGFDYYDVGRQTGQQVVRILRGEKPGDIPVERVKKLNLYVNLQAAEAMGTTIPDPVRQRAINLSKP